LQKNKKNFDQCKRFCFIFLISFSFVIRKEQDDLQQKLKQLERKLIVGGENLLDKAEKQAVLLEQSEQELATRAQNEEQLRKQLQQKEVLI
jgi:hypothetical protein